MHILAIVIVFAVREPFRLPSCSTSRPLAKMIAVGCVLVLAAALYVIALADFPHRVDGDAAAQANNAMEFLVGNGRHYGGGNVVEETAEIDDGHLDLYSLEMTNLWKLALMLRSFRSGTHGAGERFGRLGASSSTSRRRSRCRSTPMVRSSPRHQLISRSTQRRSRSLRLRPWAFDVAQKEHSVRTFDLSGDHPGVKAAQ